MLLALMAAATLAAPGEFVLELEDPLVLGTLDPQLHQDLLEQASGMAPPGSTAISVRARDEQGLWHDLEDFLPPAPPVPIKEGETSLRVHPVDQPGPSEGALSGKAVYLSQCHGWIWYDSLGRFATQRGNVWDTVEDFHNPEAMNQYLAPYLENAGAKVFTVKERDLSSLEAWVDDGGPGYAESGAGFADGPPGWAPHDTLPYGTDPMDDGTTRTFPADGGGVASWTPQVPADGYYPIYVSWEQGPEYATDAHYRILHPGGVIDRYYDQTAHGATWQYVETLWLYEGDSLTVELVGHSSSQGKLLSADAVRIGGGMGVVSRHGETTGRPRWEEGAILSTQFNSAPPSVYDPYGDGNGSDPPARSRWAAWEHHAGEDALYLSWHSNAASGTARGTVTYTYTSGYATEGSVDLADAVQDELISAFRTLWDPSWTDRGLATANFAEVNPGHNDEMPAALVELAFHDNEEDAWHLKQPEFRRDAARAMYRGIVRYWAQRDGHTPHFLPEPPVSVAVVHGEGGALVASWAPGLSGDPYGDPAESYLLYTSADGRSWDEGTPVQGTTAVLDTPRGQTVYVRVAAVNAGGVSFPSEVVGARRAWDGEVPVLVVSAFDRMDSGLLRTEEVPTLGSIVRMDLRRMNTYDTAVAHGVAIDHAEWPFDTVSDEVFDTLDLSPYRLVVWVAGEESTADESFTTAQQSKLRAWVDQGGALWASGAEILWDLDYRGSDEDRAFASEVLGALMEADAAGSEQVSGSGLLDGVGPMDFSEAAGAPYPVEWPDVLSSERPVVATYGDGGTAAVLDGGVFLMGYPFECIGDPGVRDEVAARLLPALVPDYTPPEGGDDTGFPEDTDPRVRLSELRGCGCATPAPLAGWLLLPVLAAVLRRRTSSRIGCQ